MQFYLSLVQEGETCPGASTAGGRCERGSSAPTGCYPVLPVADGASVISQPDTSRVLPDAIAPSLACTPEFARRASWSHAIEVQKLYIAVGVRQVLSPVHRELF